MSTVAIIPARGGSRRVPKKNIRSFVGKPIVSYSIEAARVSGLFDRIIVSTEDAEIAEAARSLGAEVPFDRPADLANDHATLDEVLAHALQWLADQPSPPTVACCISATAPLLRAEDLARGLEILRAERATTAIAVTTFAFPIQRALVVNQDHRLEMMHPEHRTTRSQDLEEAWHDAGQFYWIDVERYLKEGKLYSNNAVPIPLPRHLVQDIDTPEDWETAEALFSAVGSTRG